MVKYQPIIKDISATKTPSNTKSIAIHTRYKQNKDGTRTKVCFISRYVSIIDIPYANYILK